MRVANLGQDRIEVGKAVISPGLQSHGGVFGHRPRQCRSRIDEVFAGIGILVELTAHIDGERWTEAPRVRQRQRTPGLGKRLIGNDVSSEGITAIGREFIADVERLIVSGAVLIANDFSSQMNRMRRIERGVVLNDAAIPCQRLIVEVSGAEAPIGVVSRVANGDTQPRA